MNNTDKTVASASARPHNLADVEVMALLKAAPMLDRVEEAVKDISVVKASVDMQSVAAEYQTGQAAQPPERKQAQAVLNKLHYAYAQTGAKAELPALETLMRDMGLKPPTIARYQGNSITENALIGGIVGATAGSGQTWFRTVTTTAVGVVTAFVGLRAMRSLSEKFRPSEQER